jgi:3'(2'), 5'-bisphosphate nucleotidase
LLDIEGVWALDPIDGTKGFLRGGQYAVCLALIQDGEVVLGVMGTPNLPVDYNKPDGEKGVVFVGTKGEGSFQVCLPVFLLHCSLFHRCPAN